MQTQSDGGTAELDGGVALVDADTEAIDAQKLVGMDGALSEPDAASPKLDVAPPPDAPAKPDAVLPSDAAVFKPDAAIIDYSRQSQSCASDPALVLCMAFEDKVLDQSTLASPFNTASLAFQPGPLGTALLSSASTRIANNALNTAGVLSVTIQAWINPSRLPSNGRRFGIVDYQPQYSMFILPGGEITCGCDGVHQIVTRPLIQPNVWQSVACTIDDQAIKIWVDGYVRDQNANGVLCPAATDTTGLAVLGNITAGGSPYPDSFEGLADNVRVWSRARTPVEICSDAFSCTP